MPRSEIELGSERAVVAAAEPSRGADGSGSTERPVEPAELLLWALMEKFERLATDRYAKFAPSLATAEKQGFCARLDALEVDAAPLAASDLAAPVEELLTRAQSADERSTLIVQGLVLENLGQSIYRIAEGSERLSAISRDLAAAGRGACASVTVAAATRVAALVGTHERLYASFAEVSHDVLGALDALAEPVDRVFGEHFGIRFADVLGEFAADLITTCTGLGMQRRKVVAHLAGACMGL